MVLIFSSFKKADLSKSLLVLLICKVVYLLVAVLGSKDWAGWAFQGFFTYNVSKWYFLSLLLGMVMQMIIMWRIDDWMYTIGCYQGTRHTALWFTFLVLHAHPMLSHASAFLALILLMVLFLEGNFTLSKKELTLNYTANHGVLMGLMAWVHFVLFPVLVIGYSPRLQDSRDRFRHTLVLLFFGCLVWGILESIPLIKMGSFSLGAFIGHGLPLFDLSGQSAFTWTPSLIVTTGCGIIAMFSIILKEVAQQRFRHVLRNILFVYGLLAGLILIHSHYETAFFLLLAPALIITLVRGFEQIQNRVFFEMVSILWFGTILLDLLGVFVLFDL